MGIVHMGYEKGFTFAFVGATFTAVGLSRGMNLSHVCGNITTIFGFEVALSTTIRFFVEVD